MLMRRFIHFIITNGTAVVYSLFAVAQDCLRGFSARSLFCLQYFVFFLVLLSSRWVASLLLCSEHHVAVIFLSLLLLSSLRCHGLVCSMGLWHFLAIFTS